MSSLTALISRFSTALVNGVVEHPESKTNATRVKINENLMSNPLVISAKARNIEEEYRGTHPIFI